jgi:hypothetical protein
VFMVREVLKGRPVSEKTQKQGSLMAEMDLAPFRPYTDVSEANFWTLVLERIHGPGRDTSSRVPRDGP